MISLAGSVRSIQTMSVRGVMMARTGLSARRSMRSIMSRSSISSTPAWVPSTSRAFSSSSVTSCWVARCRPNTRSTSAVDFPSNQTAGAVSFVMRAIGRATLAAIGSG